MGSPNQDALDARRRIVSSLRAVADNSTVRNVYGPAQMLNDFRKYLQLSGLVNRYDQPLGSQYYGTEFQASMKAELKEAKAHEWRALMVKPRWWAKGTLWSILLERKGQNWLVIERHELEGGEVQILGVNRYSSANLLKSCAPESSLDFVSHLFSDVHAQLEELTQRRMEQAQTDLTDAVQMQVWGELLKQ